MAPHAAYDEDRDEHDEVVEFSSSRPAAGWLSRLLLAGLVIAALAVVALTHRSGGHAPQPPAPPPPKVTEVGHPLLGVTANWELFARGPGDLVTIRLARGQIATTPVPTLETGNPDVSFLVGPHLSIIRSSDFVPGYAVPAGAGAHLLTGALAGGGPFIPGPRPQEAWVIAGPPTRPFFSLVSLTGRSLGASIRFPAGGPQIPATGVSDGRGYVLMQTTPGGVADAGPTWIRPVNGNVAAVGPTRWLSVVCDATYQSCRNEVIDPADGAQRELPGAALPGFGYLPWPPLGVISPDGRIAAVPVTNNNAEYVLDLISLQTGATKTLPVTLAQQPAVQSLAWSPDGRWLFVTTARGKLIAIDARTLRIASLRVALPYLTQVAVANVPG